MDIVDVVQVAVQQVINYTSGNEDVLTLAEHGLKIAEAQVASELGYELCREHFPPEIMHSKDDHNWECSKCESMRRTGPQVGPSPLNLGGRR